jgi:hypothetical protein
MLCRNGVFLFFPLKTPIGHVYPAFPPTNAASACCYSAANPDMLLGMSVG